MPSVPVFYEPILNALASLVCVIQPVVLEPVVLLGVESSPDPASSRWLRGTDAWEVLPGPKSTPHVDGDTT